MRAEHEDALDIPSAARPRNKRNKTGIIGRVFLFQQGEGLWQIRQQLLASRQNNMMRREHGQRTTAGTAASHQNTPGLSHQRVAFGETSIATLQIRDFVTRVRLADRQTEFAAGEISQLTSVTTDFFPLLAFAQSEQRSRQLFAVCEKLEISLQSSSIFSEQSELFLEARAHRGQPLARLG